MAINVETFRIDFMEFENPTTHPDSLVQRFLDKAAAHLSESAWGSCFENGVFHLAAHNLKMRSLLAKSSAGKGVVASRTAGPLAVSFDNPEITSANQQYQKTEYGKLFEQLRDECVIGFNIV